MDDAQFREGELRPQPAFAQLARLGRLTLLALVVLLPMAIYARNGVTDSFSHYHVAITKLFLQTQNLNSAIELKSAETIPGIILMISTLSIVTNISPGALQFSILLGLVSPVVLYAVFWKLSQSSTIATLLTIVGIFSFFAPYYAIWPHGYGWLLFLTCIMLFVALARDPGDWRRLAAVFVCMFAVETYSYTAFFWLWVFILSFASWMAVVFAVRRRGGLERSRFAGLALVVTVFFFAANRLIYSSYLPKISASQARTAFFEFAARYGRFIPGLGDLGSYYHSPLSYVSISPPVVSAVNLAFVLMNATILAGSFLYLSQKSIFRDPSQATRAAFVVGLCAVVVADITGYAFYHVLLLRSIMIAAPLAIATLAGSGARKTGITVVVLLSLLSMTTFTLAWNFGDQITSTDHYASVDIGLEWYRDHTIQRPGPIGDHHTIGRLFVVYADVGRTFHPTYLDPTSYEDLLSGHPFPPHPPITDVLLNGELRTHRILTLDWGDLRALGSEYDRVSRDTIYSTTYDSGRLVVLHVGDVGPE